ncbi:MAG: exosortase/archaeosortase family protein [Oceanipulchritudo sp.]
MNNQRQQWIDLAVPFFIFLVTGIVFLPVINWLLGQTVAHEQLLHAFLVFLLSGALLVYERRISIRFVFQFSDTSQNLLILSYAVLVLSIFTRINLIVLASLSLAVSSLLLFVFGREQRRLIFSGIGAFTLFAAVAVLLPVMDWPLRTIAGKWAAYGLNLFGQNVELGLYRSPSGPMLMLFNNGQPFHVAAECNGFGMVSSSLLMAAIIVLYRRMSLFDRSGWLLMALLIGLFFNAVRIMIIVLLAPMLPEGAYMFMHETVGLITTYGGLAALYFLLMPREK